MKLNKRTSTFLWNIWNWLVTIAIIYLTKIDYIYWPIIIAVLNLITKEANKVFNPNFKK